MVKIGGLLVKIGGLTISQMLELIMLPHVGHLAMAIMVLIHLVIVVMDRMNLMAQTSVLALMGVPLILDIVPLGHTLMVIFWATRMVGLLPDHVGLVGRFGLGQMMIIFCLGPLLIV
ncbi:hypothetical protein ES288_A13G233900v1 [Gossypium darwinii]|uniref:Uncharacterized protein n=1 Tax=Gossypium darwinii TaxID=34276 RepID=A0A5D2E3P2_GOSDA|nr:hypothetical protein ES288_A13G233900v1 [Gossypium darwinii]